MTTPPRRETTRTEDESDSQNLRGEKPPSRSRSLLSFFARPWPCYHLRPFVVALLLIAPVVSMFLPDSSSLSLSSTSRSSWCAAAAAYVGLAIHHRQQRPSSSRNKHYGINRGTSSLRSSPSSSSSRLFSSSTSSTTWKDGYVDVYRTSSSSGGKIFKGSNKSRRYRLYYRIANPELLMPSSSLGDGDSSTDEEDADGAATAAAALGPAPLLVVHGGPSLPSDYLLPIADALNNRGDDGDDSRRRRSIVFYDQLGCGGSNEPGDVGAYSVGYAVDDMEAVIAELLGGGGGGGDVVDGGRRARKGRGGRGFHLYGHSFGGMLAHRYLCRVAERQGRNKGDDHDDDDSNAKAVATPRCLSVVLSSTPTSIDESESAMNAVIERLLAEDPTVSTLDERFRRTCQCRTPAVPGPLADAFDGAGTVWAGTGAVAGLECRLPSGGAKRMPPALVVGGEHDFVDPTGCRSPAGRWWTATTAGAGCRGGGAGAGRLFNHDDVRVEVLEGCSHFCLLEDGARYGGIVESFLREHDP